VVSVQRERVGGGQLIGSGEFGGGRCGVLGLWIRYILGEGVVVFCASGSGMWFCKFAFLEVHG
jgi:hypothetical protein